MCAVDEVCDPGARVVEVRVVDVDEFLEVRGVELAAPAAVRVAAPAEGDGGVEGDEEEEGAEEEGVEEGVGAGGGEDQDVAVCPVGCDEVEEGGDGGEGVGCVGGGGGLGVVQLLREAFAVAVEELDLLEAVGLNQVAGDGALAGAYS